MSFRLDDEMHEETLEQMVEREQIEEARAERAARRAICRECGQMGGHARGCPAEPPDEDDLGER